MISVDAVKNALSLRPYLDEHGVEFKGKHCRCFSGEHEDKHPSSWVYRGKDNFDRLHCGACGFDVDIIGAAMKLNGLDFKAALKLLADRAGLQHGRLTPAEARAADKARRKRERKKALVAAFRDWERKEADTIASVLKVYWDMKIARATTFSETELELLAEVEGNIAVLEYHAELLRGSDDDEKLALYLEEKGDGFRR